MIFSRICFVFFRRKRASCIRGVESFRKELDRLSIPRQEDLGPGGPRPLVSLEIALSPSQIRGGRLATRPAYERGNHTLVRALA